MPALPLFTGDHLFGLPMCALDQTAFDQGGDAMRNCPISSDTWPCWRRRGFLVSGEGHATTRTLAADEALIFLANAD